MNSGIKIVITCAALLSVLVLAAESRALDPQPAPLSFHGVPVNPGPVAGMRGYNPVGFGFGGYSYGGYPAYGFNGNLPVAYAGFNTPQPARNVYSYGAYTSYPMSTTWSAAAGPTGARLYYRGQ